MVAGRRPTAVRRVFVTPNAQPLPDDNILLGPGGQIIAEPDDPDAAPGALPDAISAAGVPKFVEPHADPTVESSLPPARIPSESLGPVVSFTSIVSVVVYFERSSQAWTSLVSTPTSSTRFTTNSFSTFSSLRSAPSTVPATSVRAFQANTTSTETIVATAQMRTSTASTMSLASSSTHAAINAAVASHHITTLYFGVVVGVIAAIAIICALVAWLFRIRSKRSKCGTPREQMDNWPWDSDGDDRHLENGIHDWHQKSATQLKLGGSHTRSPRGLFELPYPEALNQNGGSYGTPRSPSQTIPHPTIHINTNQSVPDLAPDLGRLQVTNYMPGDISSCDEASRANSRQETASEYGSPLPALHASRPRFLALGEGALEVPWAPKRDASEKVAERLHHLPSSGASSTSLHQPKAMPEGWAASLKSNIVNAFHVVVGSSTPDPPGDNLTHAPERRDTRSSTRSEESVNEKLDESPSRKNTTTSVRSNYAHGMVRLGSLRHNGSDDWDDLSAWMSGEGSVVLPEQPPLAVIKTRSRTQPGTLSRASSTYSGSEGASPERDHAPSLSIPPPLSRQSSSYSPPIDTLGERKKSMLKPRKTTRKSRRPILKSRMSSKYSVLSVGSDMSRASSFYGDKLTEDEKFASLALRERLKKMNEMKAGLGRTSKAVKFGSQRLRT
ncbi:unnamed protein product [Somion occarium]|uniref:Uncharacterized protein n=1 Tax=Somion occarium TaxID=3059160 RepID=A0ABP1CSG9_9APHY